MIRASNFFIAAAFACFITPGPSESADSPADSGWTNLFNGKDLDGWVQRGGKAKVRK